MKIKAFKLLSAVLALIIMAVSLSSCSIKDVLNKATHTANSNRLYQPTSLLKFSLNSTNLMTKLQ